MIRFITDAKTKNKNFILLLGNEEKRQIVKSKKTVTVRQII